MQLFRGVYVRPVKTRFGTRAPAAEKVIERFAATRAETVVAHGAAAANSLGLTTQVPTEARISDLREEPEPSSWARKLSQ